jgi:hypothetical protein
VLLPLLALATLHRNDGESNVDIFASAAALFALVAAISIQTCGSR